MLRIYEDHQDFYFNLMLPELERWIIEEMQKRGGEKNDLCSLMHCGCASAMVFLLDPSTIRVSEDELSPNDDEFVHLLSLPQKVIPLFPMDIDDLQRYGFEDEVRVLREKIVLLFAKNSE